MKFLLKSGMIVLCLLFTLTCCSAKHRINGQKGKKEVAQEQIVQEGLLWEQYGDAIKQSRKDKKVICLFFTGSDWCVWCVRMNQQILSSPEFMRYAHDKLHLVEVDFPSQGLQNEELKKLNEQLKAKYCIQGFPTLVFIDADGKEFTRMGFEHGGGAPFVQKMKEILG